MIDEIQLLNLLEETSDLLLSSADQCDKWAQESVRGGWSTHQVDANRKMADQLRLESDRLKKEIVKCRYRR